QSLDNWRTYLATSISWNNKELDEDELNFVVQQTIDRIIFLRIAEARGVELFSNLQNAIKTGDYYKNLFSIFREADDKYNSGLFDFKKDSISKNLKIDNKVIKNIINDLYHPSPYAFDVMPVEILGTAYEQFLGKVIRITPAHHAKIEEKPEVRKAGGVYYTPQYIVDYIVKNTVGKLVDGKTPKQVSDIKIVDPACGSGSFLLGAYQYLLDFHKNYYSNNGKPSKGRKTDLLTPDGNLATAEKKRILLNNIYGVDIDVNAVEVTKLSLLLKCMEGETNASIANQFTMFHERVLPSLENNIKCGNSLISTDYLKDNLFEVDKKIKPFDWKKAFPEVFNRKIAKKEDDLKAIAGKAKEHAQKAMEYASELEDKLSALGEPDSNYNTGGFDVVIGNPPYVMAEIDESQKHYLTKKYLLQEGKPDLYRFFVEQSHNILKDEGRFCFIIPNSILTIPSCGKLRKYLLSEGGIIEIVNFWGQVFDGVSINNIILTTQKNSKSFNIRLINDRSSKPDALSLKNASTNAIEVSKNEIIMDEDFIIQMGNSKNISSIIKKIEINKKKLFEVSNYTLGMQVYHNSIHKKSDIEKRIYHSLIKENKTYFPETGGANISRYLFKDVAKEYVSFGDWCYNKPDWAFCSGERILIREIPSKTTLNCCITVTEHIPNKAVIIVKSNVISNKFLLGILNSKLIGFYVFNSTEKGNQRLFPRVSLTTIKNLPVPVINYDNKKLHDEIVKLVDLLLKLNEEKQTAKLQSNIEQIQTRINYCEDEINKKVYELYGIGGDEIEIVEGK
ncbi:MAG: N-6 DNA methylase, partial [Bacteroidales bacterium]